MNATMSIEEAEERIDREEARRKTQTSTPTETRKVEGKESSEANNCILTKENV